MADDDVTLRIDGLAQFRRGLARIDTGLPDELKAIHQAAADLILPTARAAAPVGRARHGHAAGLLRDSIRTGATRRSAVIKAGGRRVPYAGPIHWGWPRRSIRPQTFLVDAAARRAGDLTDLYERELQEFADRIMGPG